MGLTDNSLSSSEISSTFITRGGYPGEYGWKRNYREITSILAPVPLESSTAIPQGSLCPRRSDHFIEGN